MKKQESSVRKKWLTIRMNEEEFQCFEKFRAATTEKTNSNYLRKLALNKPITSLTRNQSLDEVSSELIRLRKELNHIGVNFNQAVHKLHTLEKIAEFRVWLHTYESTRNQMAQQVEKVFTALAKIISRWSQE